MKNLIYATLVVVAPLMAQVQCPNPLTVGIACVYPFPAREFGQPTLLNPATVTSPSVNSNAPNLVVGKELYNPSAIAFDNSVSPPRVYVVDTGNNRVLGWSNANNVSEGTQADLVLGQPASQSGGFDFTATLPWGPGSANNIGLNSPTGVAVDAAGNVYVSDSGNNRILRYVTPYQQQAGNPVVDLVIGQKNVANGNYGNQGNSTPSASSLSLAVGSPYTNSRSQNPFPQDPVAQVVIPAALAIDSAGNLWATDPGNNRVLMYQKATLTPNAQLPSASLVLGQSGFTALQSPSNTVQTNGAFLEGPNGIAVDAKGDVYVTDSFGRALYYSAPVSQGQSAAVILGVPPTGSSVPMYPTQYSLGSINSNGSFTDTPQGIFVGSNGTVYVSDSPQNRIVYYTSLTVANSANSPQIAGVIGQAGFTQGQINQGSTSPTNMSLAYPVSGAIRPDNNELWVVDQANHRVLAFPQQSGNTYTQASRVLGQLDFNHNGANLLQGSELWLSAPGLSGGGVAVDRTSCTAPGSASISCSSPPHLYIADTLNNRILGFKDARSVGVGTTAQLAQTADLVIGQADLQHNLANSPANTSGAPTATGLNGPVGIAVDSQGNLWVADQGNARVVRFPAPFSQAPGATQTANLVLGQSTLTSFNPGVSQFSMEAPFGLTLFSNGSVAVSDPIANRVLVYSANGGTLTSGQAASFVIGQTGFTQSSTGSGSTQLNSPRHISVDSSDRLYVCDYNNGRVVIYSKPSSNNPPAVGTVPVNEPEAIVVSLATGVSWVSYGNSVVQIPEFENLQANQQFQQQLQQNVYNNQNNFGVLAMALDPFDNLITADSSNRVAFYFDQLFYKNSASYSTGIFGGVSGAGPTPTMLAEIHLLGTGFNFSPSYSGSPANMNPPWPTSYNSSDGVTQLQVTVAGYPAPIFRVDAPTVNDGDILIEIPNEAPSSGPATFVVSNPTTGQIYAVATYAMQQASPAIFTTNSGGTGPVAALSYDSKGNYLGINSPTVPVSPGGIIDLWLTGAGNVPGLPADGVAPGGQGVPTPLVPTVNIGGFPAQVIGSAMSSGYPGVWQINAIIPANTAPTSVSPVFVFVTLDSFNSNIGGTGTDTSPTADQPLTVPNGYITTIYVK